LEAREARVGAHAVLDLAPGVLEPSFDRPNIVRPGGLEGRIKEAVRRLGLDGSDILLLPPEPCFKAAVLAFDQFPAAAAERRVLLNHRLDKVFPLRPADVRLAYDVRPSGDRTKVFLAMARAAVIEEYEKAFLGCGLRPRTIGPPLLGLLGCLPNEPGRTAIVADIDEESIGLLAADGPEILLYRSKPFLREPGREASAEDRLDQAVTEIENTLHFLEDREGRRGEAIHVRCLPAPAGGDGASFLGRRLSIPVVPVPVPSRLAASGFDKAVFAPLLGALS
jgi:hypothetical protein